MSDHLAEAIDLLSNAEQGVEMISWLDRRDALIAALAQEAGYNLVPESILHEARFLCDRLDDLDFSMSMEDFARDHMGHVDPSHSRLKRLLAAAPDLPRLGRGEAVV